MYTRLIFTVYRWDIFLRQLLSTDLPFCLSNDCIIPSAPLKTDEGRTSSYYVKNNIIKYLITVTQSKIYTHTLQLFTSCGLKIPSIVWNCVRLQSDCTQEWLIFIHWPTLPHCGHKKPFSYLLIQFVIHDTIDIHHENLFFFYFKGRIQLVVWRNAVD